ncbi:hypothetical protein I597_0587 [Dokdonia donghaensis DSW-1]|nr:hypothetical protein I597_0587 [Dokdonia donghaensis DSW-1]
MGGFVKPQPNNYIDTYNTPKMNVYNYKTFNF